MAEAHADHVQRRGETVVEMAGDVAEYGHDQDRQLEGMEHLHGRDRERSCRKARAGDPQQHDRTGEQQAVLGADALDHDRRKEQAARLDEDLRRVEVAEHCRTCLRVRKQGCEVARELLVEHEIQIGHAEDEHHEAPELGIAQHAERFAQAHALGRDCLAGGATGAPQQ